MYYLDDENELSHFGIKGMRWGHKRDVNKPNSKRSRKALMKKAGKAALYGVSVVATLAAQRRLQKAIQRKVKSELGNDFAARMFNEYKSPKYKSPNSNIAKTMRRIRKSELGKKILKKIFGRSGGKGKAVGGPLKVAREAMKVGVPHVKS